MRLTVLGLILVVLVAACGDATATTTAAPDATPVTVVTTGPPTTATTAPAPDTSTTAPVVPVGSLDDLEMDFFEAVTGFSQPVQLVVPRTDLRWFVVDQPGVVWVIDGADPTVFLDISGDVAFDNEQGLLSMVFHPDFASNSLLYVSYTANNGDTVIESLRADGNVADADSRREILRLDQPASNHNGGMMQFGPDGNLWVGLGDGGGSNDQFGHGQRADSLLASMLRLTVGPDITGYEIPTGNLQDEVWAIGLRNPWRWSFDGDDLWIADVGQNLIEEVSVVDWKAGNPNFGWSIAEGFSCFEAETCETEGLTPPVYDYPHAEGCSVTGGVVYRGASMPELAGQFLFADYCTGWVRSVDRSGAVREWFPAGTFSGVSGFGVDGAGEVYVTTVGGSIFGLARSERP